MPKLTKKQEGFCQDYIATKGNGTEAAARNYDVKNRHVAAVIGDQNLSKPDIQTQIEQGFAKAGLNVEKFAGIISDKVSKTECKDHAKYCTIYIDMTGAKAPAKSELKQDITASVTQKEAENVAEIARQALRDSLN